MLIHKYKKDITVTSATGSDNTLKFSGGLLYQVFCKATTATNIFDISLIDEDGDDIYSVDAIEGEHMDYGLTIPMRGIFTVRITSATVDEVIRVKLLIEE